MLATFTKFVFEPVDVLYFVPSKPDGYRCLYDFGLLTKRLDNLITAKSLMKRSHAIFFRYPNLCTLYKHSVSG